MFECFLAKNYEPTIGDVPDRNQLGVVWIALEGSSTIAFIQVY